MARFSKGQSGNPTGRPKGTKNKSTEALRDKVVSLVNDNYPQIKKDLDQLTPQQRIRFWTDLLRFVLPEKFESNGTHEIQFTQEDIRKIEGAIYSGRTGRYIEEY